MTDFISFASLTTGLLIGGTLGALTVGIVSANRYSIDERDARRFRALERHAAPAADGAAPLAEIADDIIRTEHLSTTGPTLA